ncbi:odorant receptor 4-like isoform X2 [Harpegnathos saltator]|uniref:odorant receptor 4-like isoform X2 n=1 Tax=Harpegnathos saltator TaxID=610380 RepID=UPI00058CE185|nr:odorant receptor 4-like isoform X2 [Harpegnathos saltator]
MKVSTVCFSIKFVLRIFGVWPNASCVVLRRLFWSVLLIVTQVFQYAYFVVHLRTDDLPDLMDSLSCALAYTLLLIKLIIFWVNERKFHEVLTMIASDWKECANYPFGMHVTTSTATMSYRVSNAIIGLHMVAVLTYSFGVLLSDVENAGFNASTVPARPLIIKMELPFDSNSSPVYELVMVVQFFQLMSNACAIDVLNALILTLILHVGGQIDILREWLTNIFPSGGMYGTSGITIKTIIGKHQKIIMFSESVESLYSYIALMQFVSNTLIICSIGFVIASSLGNPDVSTILVKTLLFYIVMNLEAFIFCFAGEYLSTKSLNIADAAYGSHWYDMRVNESRPITFLILRSQKRLTITIGKIMDLSLERFASIIKASASYVSMLLAMS